MMSRFKLMDVNTRYLDCPQKKKLARSCETFSLVDHSVVRKGMLRETVLARGA